MNKSITLFLVMILMFSFSVPLYSEEPNNKPIQKINLSDAINIALNNNLTLQKQFEKNTIFKLRAKKEFTHFLPNLVATSDYAYNTEIETVSLPGSPLSLTVGEKNTVNTRVGLIQPITDIYKTSLKHKIAKENLNISLLDTELNKDIIVDKVSSLYYDIIIQKKVIELSKQNINSLKSYYKIAIDHYESGTALARDYMKIQIEIDNYKHRLFVEENRLNLLYKEFKELLGISLNEDLHISDDYKLKPLSPESLEELQQIAIENRPEIKQLTKQITIAKLNKRVQITDYIPEVNFFVFYVNQVGSEFLPDNNLMLGVNARYDFWQWNRKFLNVKEQKAEIKSKEIELKELERKISIEIESKLNKVNEAKNLISVSKRTVGLAEENVRITKDRYNIGLALIIDLLDDQTVLLDSQVKLVSSELDYQKSLSDLNKSLGIITITK